MPEPIAVSVEGVSVALGGREVVRGVSFSARAGSFTAIVGPNGSGKTTLLRTIAGTLAPSSGRVRVGDDEVRSIAPKQRGRTLAVLRQEVAFDLDFLVEEIVLMGRSPYKGLLDGDGASDRRIAKEALEATDAAHLSGRIFTALSGGERQRVLLSRALAQEPRLLLLDEPTNHLDIEHQLAILGAVKRRGVTVIAALHDLNHALRFADDAVLLVGGAARAVGPVEEVLTEARVAEAFRVDVERVIGRGGKPLLAFH